MTVIVQEVNSEKMFMLGGVGSPGFYALNSRTTVLEAIAVAAGVVGVRKEGQDRSAPLGWHAITS